MRRTTSLGILFFAALGGCTDDPQPEPDQPLTFSTVARLDAPGAGIAAFDGDLYVGMAEADKVAKITPSGSVTMIAEGPSDVGMYILGVAVNPAGDIFFTEAFGDRDPPAHYGVYKIPAGGGAVAAVTKSLLSARDIDIDGGKLYVTERFSNRVYEVDESGSVSVWAESPLLTMDATACGQSRPVCTSLSFRCAEQAGGPSGITHDANNRYVTEPDHGRIVRIPINADGTAGTPVVYAESCDELQGIVDIAVEKPGVLIGVRSVPTDAIVEIRNNGQTIKTLHAGAPLSTPDSITYDPAGDRWVVTNPAFHNQGTPAPAQPSVLSFTLP